MSTRAFWSTSIAQERDESPVWTHHGSLEVRGQAECNSVTCGMFLPRIPGWAVAIRVHLSFQNDCPLSSALLVDPFSVCQLMTTGLRISLGFCSCHTLRKSTGTTPLHSPHSSPLSISQCQQSQTAAKDNPWLVWSLTSASLELWEDKSFQQMAGWVLWNGDGFLPLST